MRDLSRRPVRWAIVLLAGLTAGGCGGDEKPLEPVGQTQPSPSKSPPADVAEAVLAPPLIDVETLKKALDRAEIVLLDARRADEYAVGHIAGALHVDLVSWREHMAAPGGLEDAAFWSDAAGRLGITADRPVVVYGQMGPSLAAVWWLLGYLGVNDVRVLDGSWRQWAEKYYPIDTTVPSVAATEFVPQFQCDRLIRTEDLKQIIASSQSDCVVVDARTSGEFTGQDVRDQRGGHIPGATHLEWTEVLDEGGHFFSSEKLQELFGRRGISPDKTVVVHCQSGGRSSVLALALATAGYGRVRNYCSGWRAWSADQDAPVETKTGR